MPSTINASNSGFGGIVSTGDSSGELQLQTAGTTAVTINTSQRAAFVAGTAAAPAITTAGDTNTGMFFPAADTIAFAEGGTEAMRLDSSGNVGIGTTSPVNLSGQKSVTINASGVARTDYQISGTTQGFVLAESGYFGIYTPSTQYLSLGTNNTERMRIDSSGNLLVGATSAVGSSRLLVRGSGSSSATTNIYVQNSSGTDILYMRDDGALNTGTTTSSPFNLTTGSGANAVLGSDGFLRRSTSSIKYKTDVQNAVYGLNEVMQLRPVTYKGKNDGNKKFGGLIAEEVHDAGLTEFVQYDEEGRPDALAYGHMVSLLTKAIQEQQTIINDLKSRIETLEAK